MDIKKKLTILGVSIGGCLVVALCIAAAVWLAHGVKSTNDLKGHLKERAYHYLANEKSSMTAAEFNHLNGHVLDCAFSKVEDYKIEHLPNGIMTIHSYDEQDLHTVTKDVLTKCFNRYINKAPTLMDSKQRFDLVKQHYVQYIDNGAR